MRIRIMLFIALLLLTSSADAQRKKRNVRQPAPTAQELKHKEKMDRMTANTAQVMFIDSFVVNKADFLSRYILNPETGKIDTYQKLYNTQRQPNAYVYINELGNRCYLSQENNEGVIHLYCSELVRDSYIFEDGTYVFDAVPMNFKGPDGEFPLYWKQLFGLIGQSIPQDIPGTNPQEMSRSEALVTVDVKIK